MIKKRLKTREWKKKYTYICRNGNQIDWKLLSYLELSSGIVPISICVSFEHKTYQDVRHTFSNSCSRILQHLWRIEWSGERHASGNYRTPRLVQRSTIVPFVIEENKFSDSLQWDKEIYWISKCNCDLFEVAAPNNSSLCLIVLSLLFFLLFLQYFLLYIC